MFLSNQLPLCCDNWIKIMVGPDDVQTYIWAQRPMGIVCLGLIPHLCFDLPFLSWFTICYVIASSKRKMSGLQERHTWFYQQLLPGTLILNRRDSNPIELCNDSTHHMFEHFPPLYLDRLEATRVSTTQGKKEGGTVVRTGSRWLAKGNFLLLLEHLGISDGSLTDHLPQMSLFQHFLFDS